MKGETRGQTRVQSWSNDWSKDGQNFSQQDDGQAARSNPPTRAQRTKKINKTKKN